MKIKENDESSTAKLTKGAIVSIWKSCNVKIALYLYVSQCLLPGCRDADLWEVFYFLILNSNH